MYRTRSVIFCLIRAISTSCKHLASHYDVLEITPKATQNDIKSAYYKLSKIHHPDKSKSQESATKFRQLTEAYEVLGNVQLKKMYDKGLIVGKENTSRVDYHPEPEPTDPTLKFYKSRTKRNVTPTMDGRRPIYDFDEWSRNHYGNLFEKAKYDRENLRKKQEKKYETKFSTEQEKVLFFMFAIGSVFVLMLMGLEDYDKDTTSKPISAK